MVGPSYVLSFQEKPWDVFDPVRNRLRGTRAKIRQRGADYLAYELIDAVVVSYFGILEQVGDEIENLEEQALSETTLSLVHQIHALKREVLVLRKAVWPLREMVGSLYRNETDLIQDPTRLYLRDTYDHCVQVIDSVETFRDLLSDTMDLYLSSVNNRMNEVMKVLTFVATMFIPLSFLAGIYGMNFEYMPELGFRWAYPLLLLFMVGTAIGMWLLFRRKGWV